MNIKKHKNLALESLKIQLMDRMDVAWAYIVVSIGVVINSFVSIIFFKAIYAKTDLIAGWSEGEALILLGTYLLIDNIAWMSYIRGFNKLGRFIENGVLDIFLCKPLNIRFFLIYRYCDILFSWPNIVSSILIIVYGTSISNGDMNVLLYLFIFSLALLIHYSMVVILASINFFYIVKQSDFLRKAVFELGMYPISIYKGTIRFVLTYIIPIAFIFSFPARAITGKLNFTEIIVMIIVTIVFYQLSKAIWNAGLRHYESAKG